jgi:Homing endonuclease associated repeat
MPPKAGWLFYLEKESMTKEQVVAAIKECAARLGHAPSLPELEKTTGVTKWDIRRTFGIYGPALKACGLERQGPGHSLDQQGAFVTWAEVVRCLKKIPTEIEYETYARRQARVLVRRCAGWRNVPQRMLEYIRVKRLEGEWRDVLEVILRHQVRAGGNSRPNDPAFSLPSGLPSNLPSRSKVMFGQPMYGTPLLGSPLSCAPINEMGVVFLFGAVARQQGFIVTRLQPEFPDGEALREVEPGRWQRVLIEFEYESRNFLAHGHRVEDCDLIVCWSHNWAECPLEVLELKNIVWT